MNESERLVHDMLTEVGWTVHNSGWPDFLAVRDNELRFIEVKHASDEIRPNQAAVHRILQEHGFPVEIARVTHDWKPTPEGYKKVYIARGVHNNIRDALRSRRT